MRRVPLASPVFLPPTACPTLHHPPAKILARGDSAVSAAERPGQNHKQLTSKTPPFHSHVQPQRDNCMNTLTPAQHSAIPAPSAFQNLLRPPNRPADAARPMAGDLKLTSVHGRPKIATLHPFTIGYNIAHIDRSRSREWVEEEGLARPLAATKRDLQEVAEFAEPALRANLRSLRPPVQTKFLSGEHNLMDL